MFQRVSPSTRVPDLGLGFDQALGGQRLQRLAQRGARHAEALHQLGVARQRAADRELALQDAAADALRHDVVRRAGRAGTLGVDRRLRAAIPSPGPIFAQPHLFLL